MKFNLVKHLHESIVAALSNATDTVESKPTELTMAIVAIAVDYMRVFKIHRVILVTLLPQPNECSESEEEHAVSEVRRCYAAVRAGKEPLN